MDEIRQAELRKRLLDERERTLGDLRSAERDAAEAQGVSAGDVPRYPESQADAASDTQEMEADLLTAQRMSEHVTEIDEALRLLADHPAQVMHCRDCGEPIEDERLRLVPWSRRCARCARARES